MPFDFSAQIDAWRAQLLDTTKRNRLINFKAGRAGGIRIVHPDPGEVWARLVTRNAPLSFAWKRDLNDVPSPAEEASGNSALTLFDPVSEEDQEASSDVLARCRNSTHLRAEHILTDLTDRHLAGRLTRVSLAARESMTEQGVATLYVAFGFLRWYESPDSASEIRSPLLLVPVRLERESIEAPWQLFAEDDEILPNHSLAQLMARDFRLRLSVPEEERADGDDADQRTRYFGDVQQCIRHNSRWEVLDEVALGTFSFQKLAMWDDLGRNRDRIAHHDLCRAIAGDPSVALRTPAGLPRAEDLDRETHPARTFHILDTDSSQHAAVEAAKRGASLVLDGPPGTGKSQTIANIIAEFLAAGKTVLFVSEKAAALEVVQGRLRKEGLAEFVLACHSHKANKREVIAELGRCLELGSEPVRDPSEDLDRLNELRKGLNEYVREVHTVCQPLGMSIYQVHGELARLARVTSKSRCPVPRVLERNSSYLRRVLELLARLPDCRNVIANHNHHPWRGCRAPVYSLMLSEDVRHHMGRLAACLGGINDSVKALSSLEFCVSSPTRRQWSASIDIARAVLACPLVPPAWFASEPRSVAESVIRLDDLTKAYRRTLAGLPEFAATSLRRAECKALSILGLSSHESRLIARQGDTARTLSGRLTSVGNNLKELRTQAAAAGESAKRVGDLLGLSLVAVPVKALPRIAELADLAARTTPIRKSWWDDGRRKELQAVIARCQDEMQASREARTALAASLSPSAFDPNNAGLVVEASGYQSYLARLWPRWWMSVKRVVTAWYPVEPPATVLMLDDLKKLAAYYRSLEYCRQVRELYATELLLGSDNEPDWGATLKALRAVDRLVQITRIPPSLQVALSTANGLDRAALGVAARDLARLAKTLRENLDSLTTEYTLGGARTGTTEPLRFNASELMAWVENELGVIGRQSGFLTQVVGLLTEGRDVSANALPDRGRSLAELGNVRKQVVAVSAGIWPDRSPTAVEDKDWSVLRQGAESLLHLLSRMANPVPAAVARALTTLDVRKQLADAVRQSDVACTGGFAESWEFLAGLFDLNQSISIGLTVEETPLSDLRPWLAERTKDAARLGEWTQFCDVEREIHRVDAGPLFREVMDGQVKPEEASAAFRARFLGLWLHAKYEAIPVLRQFATETHEQTIEEFRELDKRAVASAAARIRAKQLSRPDRPRALSGEMPGSSELGTLLREVNKQRRHLSLRKLFAAVPNLLTRLKPCLMMSPLAVSTYLDTPDITFDLVIFDEASQVRPYDAICAIYRGHQLIVAGDQKQLPPTSFFQAALDDDGDTPEAEDGAGGDLKDYESILDVGCTLGLPRSRLRWHYRSRRKGLIAFANHFIYGNELVTFPSVYDVAGNPAVTFEHVPDGCWKAGKAGGFNAVEAKGTAEFVLAHFRQRPGESLGVIAFSQRQQMRILDELEHLRQLHPDLEEFFREDRHEPFFVKNLENVQGDERDAIILGIGYGPDEIGRLAMRFGPLNRSGGERRLNVAVTRARERMTVVSSIRAQDIDLSRSAARGVELFRAYLDYAERGREALPAAITGFDGVKFDSPFEQEVYDELTRNGLIVHTQVGCSGFRIDLAIVAPQAPGRYLLGVECDGATYHSSATARDRDRLRQDVLERLRWRICRIWSTDWLRDREGQVRRVQAALQKAERDEPSPPPARPAPHPSPPQEQQGKTDAGAVTPPTLTYASIDDVRETELRQVSCRALQTFGATEAGELVQAISRQLGFKRTGNRIQARIEECLEALIRSGHIRRNADGRLQTATTSRTGSM